MKKHKTNLLVLGFVKLTGIIPALLFFKPRVHYMNRKVQSRRLEKPCILMSNHMSLMDFPLYLLTFPFRTIRFLISEALYTKNDTQGVVLVAGENQVFVPVKVLRQEGGSAYISPVQTGTLTTGQTVRLF